MFEVILQLIMKSWESMVQSVYNTHLYAMNLVEMIALDFWQIIVQVAKTKIARIVKKRLETVSDANEDINY